MKKPAIAGFFFQPLGTRSYAWRDGSVVKKKSTSSLWLRQLDY